MSFLWPNDLKSRLASVLLSNPLSKCESGHRDSQLVSLSFLFAQAIRAGAKISSNHRSDPIATHGDAELLLLFAVATALIGLRYVRL